MIILDENFPESQRQLLGGWHVPLRQVGDEVGRKGMQDEEILPFLRYRRRTTFFTLDLDFYRRQWCHARYCLVCVDVGQYAAAAFVRRLLRHRQFDTEAKRLATVIRLSQRGLAVLIYVLFNTFFALLTQDEQIRCCENVARHLAPSSVFLIEAFVPDVARFSGKQAVRAVKVNSDEVRLDVTHWDPVTQHLMSQHVVLTEQGVRLFPVQLRYVWPAELDLMARLAGLHLRERWESWDRSGFTADSTKHISVYERLP